MEATRYIMFEGNIARSPQEDPAFVAREKEILAALVECTIENSKISQLKDRQRFIAAVVFQVALFAVLAIVAAKM